MTFYVKMQVLDKQIYRFVRCWKFLRRWKPLGKVQKFEFKNQVLVEPFSRDERGDYLNIFLKWLKVETLMLLCNVVWFRFGNGYPHFFSEFDFSLVHSEWQFGNVYERCIKRLSMTMILTLPSFWCVQETFAFWFLSHLLYGFKQNRV